MNEGPFVGQFAASAAETQRGWAMRELIKTNDPVLLTFVESLLGEAEIDCTVADRHMSVLEGSIGVLPRRVLVADAQLEQARALLGDAGLAEWISP